MMIVAKSVKGQEFLYGARTAHKVPKASAQKICKALNDANWKLNGGEIWFVHEVDQYDSAFEYAEWQSFSIRNGAIKRKTQYGGWM